jgi:hypothetical protein
MKLNKNLIPVAVGVGDALIVIAIGAVFSGSWWLITIMAILTGVVSAAVAAKVS